MSPSLKELLKEQLLPERDALFDKLLTEVESGALLLTDYSFLYHQGKLTQSQLTLLEKAAREYVASRQQEWAQWWEKLEAFHILEEVKTTIFPDNSFFIKFTDPEKNLCGIQAYIMKKHIWKTHTLDGEPYAVEQENLEFSISMSDHHGIQVTAYGSGGPKNWQSVTFETPQDLTTSQLWEATSQALLMRAQNDTQFRHRLQDTIA